MYDFKYLRGYRMDHFYKQPKYFSKFRCIGTTCPDNCCHDWEIFWSKQEFEKLKVADLPDELKEKIENAFAFKDEKDTYIINFDENARCPFLDPDTGLCGIQKNVGADYLSLVCQFYPRKMIESDNTILRWCSTSCYHMIEMLAEDEDAIILETHLARDYKKYKNTTMIEDTDRALFNAPIKRYRMEMLDFYADILCNKERSIETSVILGALAAKHINDAVISGNYEKITKIIHDFKPQLENPATAKSLDDIKPNYHLKFKLVNNMIVKYFGTNSEGIDISSLHNGTELIVENYLTGLDNFYKAFDNKKYLLKNIIINMFYDLKMPVGYPKRIPFENYAYFVVAAAAIKTVAAAIGFSEINVVEKFKRGASRMCRGLAHSEGKAYYTMDEMKQLGLTSPAHLALIIKG